MRIFLGLILMAGALVKWRAFGSGGSSPLFEIAPQFEWLLIQIELIVGALLLIGWFPNLMWILALVLFSGFAGGSLMMAIEGRSSCGCFGGFELHPLWMLLVDSVAIVGLVFVGYRANWHLVKSPAGSNLKSNLKLKKLSLRTVAWIVVVLGGMAGLITINSSAALSSVVASQLPANVSGQYVVTEPTVIDAGSGSIRSWQRLAFRVHNRGDEPVRILGAQTDCSCRGASNLPLVIPPGERREMTIEVRLGTTPGRQQGRFWLMTSNPSQRLMLCRWTAVVTNANDDNSIVTNQLDLARWGRPRP